MKININIKLEYEAIRDVDGEWNPNQELETIFKELIMKAKIRTSPSDMAITISNSNDNVNSIGSIETIDSQIGGEP